MAWFRFPEGADRISIELQQFEPEFTDDSGRNYFRAPDHFAPKITDFKGFEQVPKPDGAVEDLPQADPLRDSAIVELSRQVDVLKEENRDLRTTLNSVSADSNAIKNQRDQLNAQIEELTAENILLRDRLENFENPEQTDKAVVEKKIKAK